MDEEAEDAVDSERVIIIIERLKNGKIWKELQRRECGKHKDVTNPLRVLLLNSDRNPKLANTAPFTFMILSFE